MAETEAAASRRRARRLGLLALAAVVLAVIDPQLREPFMEFLIDLADTLLPGLTDQHHEEVGEPSCSADPFSVPTSGSGVRGEALPGRLLSSMAGRMG